MNVSVIIPARNSAGTIVRALESLLDQTLPYWEAVVIDDGSTDNTCAIVEEFVMRDNRFRLIARPHEGVSAARNHGIQLARYDWLLFLDSDDWILPQHLERLTKVLKTDASLDVAYCGWAYITPDGAEVFGQWGGPTGDLFVQHGQYCFSVIHTYVVRRSLVLAVGGFDPSMQTCEDWDLWQRIARSGARFGTVEAKLAAYRIRPGSVTAEGRRLFADGLKVLRRGHSRDPRVSQQHPVFPEGLPLAQLERCNLGLLCACAGYLIGNKNDARPLLLHLQNKCCVRLDPYDVAEGIFIHAMVAAAKPRGNWYRLWSDLKDNCYKFLVALENYSGSHGLAHRSHRYLKHLAAKHATDPLLTRRIASVRAQWVLGIRKQVNYTCRKYQLLKHLISSMLLLTPRLKYLLRRLRYFKRHRGLAKSSSKNGSCQRHFDNLFTEHADPWDYGNAYEQMKYEQTLALIPEGRVKRALELGCAEGDFTCRLAPRVEHLWANDISQVALERAVDRCKEYRNVSFQHFDLMNDPVPTEYDLIVCSEVLYYLRDRKELPRIADKLARSLRAGGHLLMTHANIIADDPNNPGFSWHHSFGGKAIGETFARNRYLEYIKRFRTPLYEIQLFRRRQARARILPRRRTKPAIELAQHGSLPANLASQVVWTTTNHLPILLYGQLGLVNSDEPSCSRVTPEVFEEQLQFLRRAGFRSIKLDRWRWAIDRRIPLTDRPILLAFDEGSRDFLTYALPLLERYGFSATVFVYTDEIGQSTIRDPIGGGEILPLSWKEVRQLRAAGLTIGSHSTSRQDLTSQPLKMLLAELKRSRETLQNNLGAPVSSFAYPLGKSNKMVQYLVAASGYSFGLSNKPGLCKMTDSLLALPCIRVQGRDNLETFAARLGVAQPSRALG